MKHCSTLTALGIATVTALTGGLLATPAHATTPTCFGEPATITGTGYIQGTAGRDVVVANGVAEVHALGGDDLVCGAFLAYGGPGDDKLRYGGRESGEIRGGRGDDLVVWRSSTWGELTGDGGHDRLRATRGAQLLAGSGGNDVLRGGAGADMLFGARGNDIVVGGRGADELDGGPGFDYGDGDAGDDTCARFEEGPCAIA